MGALIGGSLGGTAIGGLVATPFKAVYDKIKHEDGIDEVAEKYFVLKESIVFINNVFAHHEKLIKPRIATVREEISTEISKEDYVHMLGVLNAENSFCMDGMIAHPSHITELIYQEFQELYSSGSKQDM